MPLFNNIINKLSQVNLSDINHELGKAKENIVNETGNYLGSSQVGNMIRSESTKFGNIFGAKPKDPPSLPKSTSLPVIQGLSPEQYRPRNGSSTAKHLGSKYKYRSSYCEQEDDSEGVLTPGDLIDEDSIVNKFIKVVGSEENSSPKPKPVETAPIVRSASLSSREDIRKKLASFGEEETIPEEDDELVTNTDLEICFINETASDDEGDVMVNPLESHSDDENLPSLNSISNQNFVHKSKSDGDGFKSVANTNEIEGNIFKEEKHKIQATAKVSLSQCKHVAKRQLAAEKQKRLDDDPLKKLLGVSSNDINQDLLSGYNINILQFVLNDFREKIEQHSTELVNLLIQKDELETEQDSMLIDIEDISHSSLM